MSTDLNALPDYCPVVYCTDGAKSFSADSILFDKTQVRALLEHYRSLFTAFPNVSLIDVREYPDFTLMNGHREDADDFTEMTDWLEEGWRHDGLRIYRDGAVYIRFYQKHVYDMKMEARLI
jgi:hypothetical protein